MNDQFHTTEVEEILGNPPHSIVRYGTLIFSVILISLITGSIIFKYPDIIKSQVLISSDDSSISIYSKSDGRLQMIFVSNMDSVGKGQHLAVVGNESDYKAVFELIEILKNVKMSSEEYAKISLPQFYNLGEIQSYYSRFKRYYIEYITYISQSLAENKITSLNKQIEDYNLLIQNLNDQILDAEMIVQLTFAECNRDSILFTKSSISFESLKYSKKDYLQAVSNKQNLITLRSNATILLNQINYQISNIQIEDQAKLSELKIQLQESLENLVNEISKWENKYVLVSSKDGIVSFSRLWSLNQSIFVNEKVFDILSIKSNQVIGNLSIPIQASSQIKIGQSIIIQLDDYPQEEFGNLIGLVESKSLVTSMNGNNNPSYMVSLSFPEGLITSGGIEISANQNLSGSAEIKTNNFSILHRILKPQGSRFDEFKQNK